MERATKAPRVYALHATMKAPFRPAPGIGEAALNEALRAFCARRRRFTTGPLRLTRFDRWLALVPTVPHADLDWLADQCVVHFDHFRAPLSPEDRARRGTIDDPLHAMYLEQFGYPGIFAAFGFHITLAGPLERLPNSMWSRQRCGPPSRRLWPSPSPWTISAGSAIPAGAACSRSAAGRR